MSQIDPTRNYYADLEVPQNAGTEDIRKSFRKLALAYHPDRNPGKEHEVVPKFQAIQAASEILLDPQQRAKYDADRRKQGRTYGGGPSTASWAGAKPAPPARNPYRDAPSNFPPPPRRTGPSATRQRSDYTPRTGTKFGAADFAKFGKATNAQRPDTEDAERRANNFSAWQKMHHKAKAEQTQEARRREESNRPFGTPPSVPPRATPAYSHVPPKPNLGRSNTARTTRKAGFDPARPGADEPQATGTSGYYNTARHDNPPPQVYTDVPPQSPNTTSAYSSPGSDAPYSDGRGHIRPPYAQRSAFSPLGRSASTRASPNRPVSSEQAYFAGQGGARPARSASPVNRKPVPARDGGMETPSRQQARAGNATRPFAFDQYASSEDEQSPPATTSGATLHSQQRPHPQADTSNINGRAASNSRQPGSMYDNSLKHSTFKVNFNLPGSKKPDQPEAAGAKRAAMPAEKTTRDHHQNGWKAFLESSISAKPTYKPGKPAHWLYPLSVAPPSSSSKKSSASLHSVTSPFAFDDHFSMASIIKANMTSPRFTMPITDETFTTKAPEFKSRSSESINTKFSPDGWKGKFQGAPDYFAPPPDSSNGRPKTSPTRASGQSVDTPPVKFSPSQWQSTFKDPSWAYPQPDVSPSRPQVPSRPMKASKLRSGKVPKAATVNDAAEEPELQQNGSADSLESSGDGSAMDIDEDIPPVNGSNLSHTSHASHASRTSHTSNGSKSPRKVSVTPDKPEWRGDIHGNMNPPPPPPPPPTSTSNPEARASHRSAFSMGSFSHVAPFGTASAGAGPHGAAGGLNHVSDLRADLPFESAPAPVPPHRVFTRKDEIMVPGPPRTPPEPQRISKASWTEYIKQLSSYMSRWTEYDAAMVSHFASRQAEVDTICRAFADPHNNSNMTGLRDAGRFAWLGAVGDTAQGGFGSYLQGLKDDEAVREHWAVACDKHRACMQRCLGLRERVLREAEAGRLPDV
ncbi:hypothetical protein EJ05DRAFT_352945 [Pseudovirgaria hyperparasitica]|uniref:J domain-containing protein n=1 Tax=Pseudovirgaria hyperparasitica TaxID=470096 RepID=A0A6A6W795_9PEZI|nr:uncharacterized protein EJ05DRAFT_352945 [Pseudovirgaria hyperparasitica]KAF2758503.1 hypothetical protein EJ05DRAFT_352945 [Pseudovirgaria hyperparasitica]